MRNLVFLVRKDLVAARWFLLAAVPIYALQLLTLDASPPVVMLLAFIFSALFAFGNVGIEEVQGTEATWCSLPVERESIVVARYLTTTLGLFLGLGLAWAVPRGALGPAGLAALFFVLQLGAAIFYPCYFRLGAGKGLTAFALIVLGIVSGSALVRAAVSLATDAPYVPDPQRLASLEAWLEPLEMAVAAGLVLVALLAAACSAALAARWYAGRDC